MNYSKFFLLIVTLLVLCNVTSCAHIANILNIEQIGDIGESEYTQNDTANYSEKDNEQITSIISEAETIVNNDIAGAISRIQTGLATYPKSADLQNKLDEYTERLSIQIKADTLDKAAELADSGDYVAAMAVIENARKDSPDDTDYKSVYDKYAAAHKSNLVSEALESADTLFANGDYLGALQTVNQALKSVGDDNTLTIAAKTYEDAYAKSVSAQVDAYLAEQNITAAKQLLATASKEIPNNAVIKDQKTEFEKYKTVSLSTLTPINGGFTWNEGTPADPFENDYTNVKNYTIFHGNNNNHHYHYELYAEYKVDKQYNNLSFTISPYSDFGENASSYLQIYVNDVLRYTSDVITKKTGQVNVSLDISDANTVKIVVRKGDYACVMLSDVILTNNPNFTSSIVNDYISLSTLSPLNGGFSWNNDYPIDPFNNKYNDSVNYTILHGNNDNHHYHYELYAEYYIDKKYKSLSFNISPYSDYGNNASTTLKVYVDEKLVYSSPTVKRNSNIISVPDISLNGASYLKIVVSKGDYGCLMLSDVKLIPAS